MNLYGVFDSPLEETLTSDWPGTFYGNPCPKGRFVQKKCIGPIAINIFRGPCQAFFYVNLWEQGLIANLRLIVFILTCSPFSASLALASRSRRVRLRLNSAMIILSSLLDVARVSPFPGRSSTFWENAYLFLWNRLYYSLLYSHHWWAESGRA